MIDATERVLDMHDYSPVARLVYLALREDGAMTASELSEAVGISHSAAARTARQLTDDNWTREDTREQSGPGPSPSEWVALVECDRCDGRFLETGLPSHEPNCDDRTLTSYDLEDMDPEDLGLGGDKPEPERGIQ